MLTDVASRSTPARFALRFAAYSLALFGALRLGWLELHVVSPFAAAQGVLAASLFGTPAAPMITTLACSGTDAIALCMGAVLAYPARWISRLTGALAGLALIVGVNIIRIGTLGRAAGSGWFDALHVFVWPTILTFMIGGYLFVWTRRADAAERTTRPGEGAASWLPASKPARVFVALTIVLMLLFIAMSPLYLESPAVLELASFMAGAAAVVLGAIGIPASHTANVLVTDRGALLVTQECITTPLIPVYLAAVTAFGRTWRWRTLGYLATVPIFVALGIARLLVVALPAALVGSPLFLIHAFYQLALGAVVVAAFAIWRHGRRRAFVPAAAGLVVGAVFLAVAGAPYSRAIATLAGTPVNDPQGAIAFLPGFQIGLYLALSAAAFAATGWRRLLAGAAALALTQVIVLAGLLAVSHTGLPPDVRDVRAWAVAAPLLIFLLARRSAGARTTGHSAQPQP